MIHLQFSYTFASNVCDLKYVACCAICHMSPVRATVIMRPLTSELLLMALSRHLPRHVGHATCCKLRTRATNQTNQMLLMQSIQQILVHGRL